MRIINAITHKQENECTEAAIAYIRRRYLYERKESPFDQPENKRHDEQPKRKERTLA